MRLTQVLAISLFVVLLSSGIESYRLQRDAEEDGSFLSTAKGYFDSAISGISSLADGVYGKVRETGVPDKIREMYDQAAEKVTIYYGVLSDQVYHLAGSQ